MPGLRPRRRKSSTSRREVVQRARKLLDREIGFVPSTEFRFLDADAEWQREFDDYGNNQSGGEPDKGWRPQPTQLAGVFSAPILQPAEEKDLFLRLNYAKYRANSIRSRLNLSRPAPRRVAECEKWLERAEYLRNRIIQANTRLVVSIVKQFVSELNPFDDLLSEGINCLFRVVDKFDVERGFKFSTYATMAIRREVLRFVKRCHRDRARFSTGNYDVLDQRLDEVVLERQTELASMSRDITRMLSELDERERYIVKARHGFIDIGAKPTFMNLGQQLGVSKERVRQLESRAKNKLRDLLQEWNPQEDADLDSDTGTKSES